MPNTPNQGLERPKLASFTFGTPKELSLDGRRIYQYKDQYPFKFILEDEDRIVSEHATPLQPSFAWYSSEPNHYEHFVSNLTYYYYSSLLVDLAKKFPNQLYFATDFITLANEDASLTVFIRTGDYQLASCVTEPLNDTSFVDRVDNVVTRLVPYSTSLRDTLIIPPFSDYDFLIRPIVPLQVIGNA